MVTPTLAHTWTCHFAGLTAGIFFRRSILKKGLFFDASYRAAADAEWYVRLLRSGVKARTLSEITSVFREDGENLGLSLAAREERIRLNQTAPVWMQILRPWWVLWHRSRRWLRGCHNKLKTHLEIYDPRSSHRKEILVNNLRTTWPGRTHHF
jgi:hypothetical protein